MRVSNIIHKEKFDSAIEEGIYTILPSNDAEEATKNSKEYTYYKVEYLNSGLYKKTIFVAVWC